jgi:hypothetical protein
MKTYEYILSRQIQWAYNKGIQLIDSKGWRGKPAYTAELNENLFEPLEPSVRKSFLRRAKHKPEKTIVRDDEVIIEVQN